MDSKRLINEEFETEDPNTPEIDPEEPEIEEESESILISVKKLLGINNMDDFDQDIIIHINSSISILRQLGIGPAKGFMITGKGETYRDYLGEDSQELSMVKQYLYCKVRKIFDPPTSGSVMSALDEQIKELEFRLNFQVDPRETFGIESASDFASTRFPEIDNE